MPKGITNIEQVSWFLSQAIDEGNTFAARLDALAQAEAIKLRSKKSWYWFQVIPSNFNAIGVKVAEQFAEAIKHGCADSNGTTTYKRFKEIMAEETASEAREVDMDEGVIEQLDSRVRDNRPLGWLPSLSDMFGDEDEAEFKAAAINERIENEGSGYATEYVDVRTRVQMKAKERFKWESEANNLPPIGQARKTPWWSKLWSALRYGPAYNRLVKKQDAEHGNAVEAMTFALTIEDHYDLREFLKAWNEGDWATLQEEWEEYYTWLFEERHC